LFLAAALALAAALVFAMIELQTQLLFPAHAVAPAGPLPRGAERVSLQTADGNTLHGVHIPPAQAKAGDSTLILGFPGNAWNSEDAATLLHQLYPEAHVVAFHYRGYRPSTGSPSAEALLADAPLVYDFAVGRVKPEHTVAVGFSIGSGVAANLAKARPLDGVILVTPFDSLKAVAQSLYPWLPIGPFFRHEMDAATALSAIDVPVAIIAAEHDQIVFPERTAALRPRVRNLVFDRTIAGAGHNDIYARSEFAAAMHDALAALTAPR
jgi:pimeloyl-ACP methyl ester carboxylesterase